ncbi:hypothetical protein [Schleiferilactobacillus harbinensis]|uniref:DUF4352 domain-containing protein n=1 Tax=Schleiferilactobacillus harbinensis TaxID=304207 RepID=A0A5P8M3K8_9LACO|nr:hypothetical protein [Schleiferilactobacillus harbinensis]QFR23076.1 hypothetical protein D1010_06455 [Schleiferilactobacillus harbinensis]
MKKSVLMFLGTAALFSLGGCGTSQSKPASSSSKASNKATTAKRVDFKPQTLPKVGVAEYTITGISVGQVTNNKDNWTNAEYNFSGIKQFPKKYWRATISYQLKNVGTKPFDLSYQQATVIGGDNVEFTDSGSDRYGYDGNSNGLVQPGTATTGKFILLSVDKPSLGTFKINQSKQVASDGSTELGAAGVTEYK